MKQNPMIIRTICMLLLIFVMAGIGSGEIETRQLPDTRNTIRILAAQTSEGSEDAPKVVESINDLGLDYKVEFIFIPFQSLNQTIHQYFSTGEQLDIIFGSNTSLFELFCQNNLLPLDNLLSRYGQGILDAVNEEYFKVGRYEGQQYALPINRNMASAYMYEYRADIAEQYGLDLEAVSSLDDLESVFERLTAQTGDILPLANYQLPDWDSLGDNLGVLMDRGREPLVVNLYETERYREYTERIFQWRKNGWALDTLSISMTNTAYLRSGKVLGCFGTSKPGIDVQETRSVGYPVRSVEFVSPYVTTDQVGITMWAITNNSLYPELAMDFLNRMYTDAKLYNLLTFGIENEHYVFVDKENQVIGYPPGVDAESSGYAQFLGWMYGNQYLSYIWNGNDTDIWERTREFNDTAYRSSAMGFVFDASAVEDLLIGCQAAQNKYASALESGYLDPAIYLEQLNRELDAAGIDTIIFEKQKQLDKWLGDEQ